MTDEIVHLDIDGPRATVTLDSQHNRNALSRQLVAELFTALEAAEALGADGWSVAVINARFAKPLDRELILAEARGKRLIVTFEESVVTGGFGSGVLEAVEEARLRDPDLRDVPVRIVGIPGDAFVDHGSVADLRRVLRLDAPGLADQVRETAAALDLAPSAAAGSVA